MLGLPAAEIHIRIAGAIHQKARQVHAEEGGHEDGAGVVVHRRRPREAPTEVRPKELKAVLLRRLEALELVELIKDDAPPIEHLQQGEPRPKAELISLG